VNCGARKPPSRRDPRLGEEDLLRGAELKDVLAVRAGRRPEGVPLARVGQEQMRALETLGIPWSGARGGRAGRGGRSRSARIAASAGQRRSSSACPSDDRPAAGCGGVTKMSGCSAAAAFPYLVRARRCGRRSRGARPRPGIAANGRAIQDGARMDRAIRRRKQPWTNGLPHPGGGPGSPKVSQMLAIAPAMVVEKTRGLYPAPRRSCRRWWRRVRDFDTALRIESRYLAKLASRVAKNLITLFFNRTAIRPAPRAPKTCRNEGEQVASSARHDGPAHRLANMNRACPACEDVTLEKRKRQAYSAKLLEREEGHEPADADQGQAT